MTTSLLQCVLQIRLLVDNEDHPSLSSPSSTGDDGAANKMWDDSSPFSCISIIDPQHQLTTKV